MGGYVVLVVSIDLVQTNAFPPLFSDNGHGAAVPVLMCYDITLAHVLDSSNIKGIESRFSGSQIHNGH